MTGMTVDLPRSTRAQSLLLPRPDRATLPLEGPDVLGYLHAVTSQHLQDRVSGASASALWLGPKGRVLFELRVVVRDDGALLDVDADAVEALVERLGRFRFRRDVTIGEPGPGGFTLTGPARLDLATQVGLLVPAEGHASLAGDLVVDRSVLGLELLGAGAQAMARRLRDAGAQEAGPDMLELLRVERGLPRWGLELTDDVVPEEAGLIDSHVHLRKGCYPGQESVARIHNLGQVQRRLAGITAEGTDLLPFRAELRTGEGGRAGQVRTSVLHPELGVIALAYVRHTLPAGTPLLAGDRPVTVADLPFRPPTNA